MFVVYDIETTGFSEINNDIVEFAYILFDDNANFVKSEQLYFYYEGMHWSEEAFKIHQIPLSFLKQHKDKFKENIIKMYTVLNHANVVGHNCLHFDCPFVKTWLMRQGLKNLEYRIIQDTMIAYKPIYKRARIKLTKLIDYIGVTPDMINTLLPVWFEGVSESHAHEAAYDVVATALLALRGLEKKLITFEPLVKLNTSVATEDLDAMFAVGTELDVDPHDYIILFKDKHVMKWGLIQHHPDGKFKGLLDTVTAEGLVPTFKETGRIFPVLFEEENILKFHGEDNDAEYILRLDAEDGYEFTVKTNYGKFTNETVSVKMLIENMLPHVDMEAFMKNKEDFYV